MDVCDASLVMVTVKVSKPSTDGAFALLLGIVNEVGSDTIFPFVAVKLTVVPAGNRWSFVSRTIKIAFLDVASNRAAGGAAPSGHASKMRSAGAAYLTKSGVEPEKTIVVFPRA